MLECRLREREKLSIWQRGFLARLSVRVASAPMGAAPPRRAKASENVRERQPGLRSKEDDNSDVDVFLNIPYDPYFVDLFLAYTAGLTSLGLFPRATLEIAGGERRLDRTLDLIQRCRYSLHDLSRVQVDAGPSATPRFNMPFELGLAVAWQRAEPRKHTWFVFEAKTRRIERSLSDLSGTDVYIHHGRPSGIFSELTNAFVRSQRQPSVDQMKLVYKGLREGLPKLMRNAGTKSAFKARVFDDLRVLARALSERHMKLR